MNDENGYLSQDFLEEQEIYELIVYLPVTDMDLADNTTINNIVDNANKMCEENKLKASKLNILKSIESIIKKNNDLGKSTMSNMSWKDNDDDGKQDHPANGMVACTFNSYQTGATFVTFRGTPDGAWVDNAKMLLGELLYCKSAKVVNEDTWNYLSPMQAEAVEYMNSLVKKYGTDWLKEDSKQYVIGHSKGGNQVQVIMMLFSEYFEAGLSMDGPGISKELYGEMKKNLGEKKMEKILTRLYALNGLNDYVHALGVQLVLIENSRWFKEYQYGKTIEGNHFPEAFINIETGELAEFTDGPGPFANFIRKVSETAMDLPPKEREAVFMTLMLVLQLLYAKELPVNPLDERWLSLYANLDNGGMQAFGIILSVVKDTEEGAKFVDYLREQELIKDLERKLKETLEWYNHLPLALQLPVAGQVAGVLVMITALVAILSKTMDMAELFQYLIDGIKIMNEVEGFLEETYIQMVKELEAGYRKGCAWFRKTASKGKRAINNWLEGKQRAESGKIGSHYKNAGIVFEMMNEMSEVYYRDVETKLQEACHILGKMKYWRADQTLLLQCMDTMGKLNRRLYDYRIHMENNVRNQQKMESQFIAMLNKNK